MLTWLTRLATVKRGSKVPNAAKADSAASRHGAPGVFPTRVRLAGTSAGSVEAGVSERAVFVLQTGAMVRDDWNGTDCDWR